MHLRFFFVIVALVQVSNCFGLNVADQSRFVCKQGACSNGHGVVWDAVLRITMEGNWLNGQTIADEVYTVTSPANPTKQFKQVYGADGLQSSGDQLRNLGYIGSNIPFFTGVFTRTYHAFLRQTVPVIKEGVYTSGNGYEYRGRFEYIAAKSVMQFGWPSGYFIFYGDCVDTVENETETGLYISNEAPAAAAIQFVKADPSYLAVLQNKYQNDMQLAVGEFQRQDSINKWKSVFAAITMVAFSLTSAGADLAKFDNSMGGGLASSFLGMDSPQGGVTNSLVSGFLPNNKNRQAGNFALSLVLDMFNKGDASVNVEDLALKIIDSNVKDSGARALLSSAVHEGLGATK